MANVTFDLEVTLGVFEELLLEFEVDFCTDSDGDIQIDDYYVYFVTVDENSHRSYDKVPYWLHQKLGSELEDYKYNLYDHHDGLSA